MSIDSDTSVDTSGGGARPFMDVRDIRQLVGQSAFERGQQYSSRGSVIESAWDPQAHTLTGTVKGSSLFPYECKIMLQPVGTSSFEVSSSCTCPVGADCKHVAATLIRNNLLTVQDRMRAQASPSTRSGILSAATAANSVAEAITVSQPAWKTALASITNPGGAGSAGAGLGETVPLGLMFELRELVKSRDRWRGPTAQPASGATEASERIRLAVRPVMRSGSGNWVRSSVSWNNFGYHTGRLNLNADHQGWFAQFLALNRATRETYGYTEADWIYLDDFASPLLWKLFATAAEVGIALISGKKGDPVLVGERAVVSMDVTANPEGGIRFGASLRVDEEPLDIARTRIIGEHGIYAWDDSGAPKFVLAPTEHPITDEQAQLIDSNPSTLIPAEDVDEFLTQYYPKLRRTVGVISPDNSVELPQIEPPKLILTAAYSPEHKLKLDWSWEYAEGRTGLHLSLTKDESFRDVAVERDLTVKVDKALEGMPFRSPYELEGLDAAEFTSRTMPKLAKLEGVMIEVVGEQPDYRELTDVPKLTVTTVETDQRDWFDLGVIVTIDGKKVPFGPLFKALSKGTKKLLLIDNSYLSLDQPVFDQLKSLIAEASELAEWDTGMRISRYQASLWSEFEDLAEDTEQAVAWRASVSGLLALAESSGVDPTPLPTDLTATLRPYQQDGFDWLVFLWKHQLGGILADDMGLGKTVQTLALISHAVDQAIANASPRKPFLVVAPTSVVSNWLSEAKRFAPHLVVRGIEASEKKSGSSVSSIADDADLVITSYALFRIDFAGYQKVSWEGLILDEAQFAKNAASKAHGNAVDLNAPFKLAITGTPMENSLTDLWSLFRIVAPGLFPSDRRFREDYLRPIAAGSGAAELAKLRKRIRPLMMRRTKELVAADLPAKQEQVLHIDLSPRHKKLYDTFLQKERQKLLGLIDDMDKNRFIVFRSLTLLRMLSLDASLVDDKYSDIPSSKLDALFEQLEDVVAEGHRALIFSQFTTFLKKTAARMEAEGIAYEYLDGSTLHRPEVIDRFRNGDAPVFLISLKAGGFGLNLTEADYVFLLDPWWNPAAEEQAIDRTHRIGQTRSVNVYRMVATGTIEEKVMALKEKKARLFDAVMDDDAAFSTALTAEDIRSLLDG